MARVPGDSLLAPKERSFFVQHFEQDLQFFQLLLLLINKSCPIKNVDLVWTEVDRPGRVRTRYSVGTQQALSGPWSSFFRCEGADPNPTFCNLVHDFGRRMAESCTISDRAAEERVRQTGKAEVYRCHAGLIDIAVPVLCDGQHIATLYSGQVLTSPPTDSDFAQTRKSLERLAYIELQELEKAYQQVPVVSEEDIQETVRILEIFAEYLATSWKRLREVVRAQHREMRESQIDRKEFAHIVLEGGLVDGETLRRLMKRIRFTHYPNRVMVVRLENTKAGFGSPAASLDVAFTAALHAIEELTENMQDIAAAYLRDRGVCILLSEPDRGRGSVSTSTYALARKILSAITACCDIHGRIGIGSAKSNWRYLPDSYHEACVALLESADEIAVHKKAPRPMLELSTQVEELCRHLYEKRIPDARLIVMALPLLANQRFGATPDGLASQQRFFFGVLESLWGTARKMGCGDAAVARLRSEAAGRFERTASVFELHETFSRCAGTVLDELSGLHAGRHTSIAERARGRIDRSLEGSSAEPVSLAGVAVELGVSAGHLSRVFKKVIGTTFERYVMTKRVEMAQRQLLEPLSNISDVAERCGFATPAYFARVFRKITGRSPSDYRKDPFNARKFAGT